MASREEVEDARNILRSKQWNWGKPGSRMHETGLVVPFTINNALSHPCCGECSLLSISPVKIDGKESVNLRCAAGHSPYKLWIDWLPGQDLITCPDCTDPEGRP